MAWPEVFERPFPDSIEEHNRHEEQRERRAEAFGRYSRQQFELFELDQLFPNARTAESMQSLSHSIAGVNPRPDTTMQAKAARHV